MGGLGDIGALLGHKGSNSLTDLTKSQPIQSSLDDLISQYKSNVSTDSSDLSSFLSNYLKQTPQATKFANEETGAIGGFYNGDVAQTLAKYRAQQGQLGDLAVSRALAQNRGNMNRSVLGGGGSGDSSWNNRYGLNVASGLNYNNDLNLLDKARGDYSTVLQGQISLAGQRQALQDALMRRGLVPSQTRQAFLGNEEANLNNIASINNANHMYGVQYNPSKWELAGNVVNDTIKAALMGYSMVGAGGAGATGAGATGGQMAALSAGYGPLSAGAAGPAMTPGYPSGPAGFGLSNGSSVSTLPWEVGF